MGGGRKEGKKEGRSIGRMDTVVLWWFRVLGKQKEVDGANGEGQ